MPYSFDKQRNHGCVNDLRVASMLMGFFGVPPKELHVLRWVKHSNSPRSIYVCAHCKCLDGLADKPMFRLQDGLIDISSVIPSHMREE